MHPMTASATMEPREMLDDAGRIHLRRRGGLADFTFPLPPQPDSALRVKSHTNIKFHEHSDGPR